MTVNDLIVFSWGGTLQKGRIGAARRTTVGRTELIVIPLTKDGKDFPTTAKVKDSRSTVKI